MADVACIDCIREGVTNWRPPKMVRGLPVAGMRCATHWRARRAVTRDASWARNLMKNYALTPDEYWAIYEAQDGCCYFCRRAKGHAKKLCVDHDHATGYVRGLLCNTCNKILGHFRDNPEAGIRLAYYLMKPPAFDQIGQRYAPITAMKNQTPSSTPAAVVP